VADVQGSAADLIKLAMCRWDEWVAGQQQQQQGEQAPTPPGGYRANARLIAQIHGEHHAGSSFCC
jgi:DNA polymerase I-like protein with 3'-5' exonuclease and polymerase domains